MTNKLNVCSLFAGIGGIDLAFERAGFHIAYANEFEADACKTYRHNFSATLLSEQDIRNIIISDITDFDVLTAGFPCQPFSVCGRQLGFDDHRGNLFFEILRVIDEKHPAVIFLENVANLVEHDNGNTFQRIRHELSLRKYSIRYTVADACDYGVPQHRTRIYIVAFLDSKQRDRFRFPPKITLQKHLFDIIDRTVKAEKRFYLNEMSPQYVKMSSAITDVDQIYRFSDYGVQKSRSGISFTLKANMGTWPDRVPIIRDNFGIRALTPNECLALQGFPPDFHFPDIPLKSMYKQCGNTVVVPVVEQIARHILKSTDNPAPHNPHIPHNTSVF